MIESVNVKTLFKGLFFSLLFLLVFFCISYFDNRTTIIFCDVGQGDGAYIRIKNRFDVVIDAGPDRKILNCLGKYMPFYDRIIEFAFISHDQKDHFAGLIYLNERYTIKTVFVSPLQSNNETYLKLEENLKNKKVEIKTTSSGMIIKILGDFLKFYSPKNPCIARDNNDCSQIFTFVENNIAVLFTGDASPKVLGSLLKETIRSITILKVPHHGSKNGLTESFLRLVNPRVAVISVGKKNAYGHPHKEILDMLQSHKVKIRRTDLNGDIIFRLK